MGRWPFKRDFKEGSVPLRSPRGGFPTCGRGRREGGIPAGHPRDVTARRRGDPGDVTAEGSPTHACPPSPPHRVS